MIWRLLHLVFGWDYVQWDNSVDHGVARVHVDGHGKPYYWSYKLTKVADRITETSPVIWLTCHSSKYLGDSNV